VPGRLAVARPILPLYVSLVSSSLLPRGSLSFAYLSSFARFLSVHIYIGLAAIFCVPPNRSSFLPTSSRVAYPVRGAEVRGAETAAICLF
jgi:hypothetical protein